MLSPSEFHNIVSGRRTDWRASLWRILFSIIAVPYGIVVALRNWRYDQGHATIHSVPARVICVGNLTLGGTGKTPMIAWLVKLFESQQKSVAIVSRGYGSKSGEANDESRELAERLPDTPHVQNPDRVAGAESAIKKHAADIILLDDGFQHRRLHRDVDIVLIDALQPFGYDHLFPRGCLRESLLGLQRAHVAILTRSELVEASTRERVRKCYLEIAPDVLWLEASHSPVGLFSVDGDAIDLHLMAGKQVAAFCGIGNPAGFRQTLVHTELEVVEFEEFPDHHKFTNQDIKRIESVAHTQHADFAVCTHKDLVKVAPLWTSDLPLFALQIEMKLDNESALKRRLFEG